ncbi:MAG: EAL domain-containing protein [Pseudomonadota bacterium]|nr:EAL domain-containing protein [Pseudomonadota bacterium]
MDASELLQAVIDSPTQHGIVVTDAEGIIRLWNTGAARIFQYSEDEILGRNARVLFTPHDRDRHLPEREMARALRNGCTGDFRWHTRSDGGLFWADGMIYPLRSRSGHHVGFVKVLRDATRQKQSDEATSRLALQDSLTGLPNRLEFRNRFVDMAASAKRRHQVLIMLLLDLDDFKPVNDELGHSAGDLVLQQVARRMRRAVRDTDFVARLGGDEFAVLLPDAGRMDAGAAAAEKLIAALSRPFAVGERHVLMGASVGISVYPHDEVEFDALFRKADLALYRAKFGGRGTYRFYAAQMDTAVHQRAQEQSQLRRAVKDRAFHLEYLPQVDADGRVLAMEALLRCSSDFFAGYGADRLVGLAAETGRLRRLGLWAASEGFRQIRKWQGEGWRDLHLIMNFSDAELTDPRFLNRLKDLMTKIELSPAHLEIDVPECALGGGVNLDTLERLQACGLSITIDDLGSGGLSLKHLLDLPIRTVKLDLGLFPGLPDAQRSRDVCRAVTGMCRTIGMRVVAESVETQAQADFIRPLCDAMQGFHIVPPMSAHETTAWLQSQTSGHTLAAKMQRRLERVFGHQAAGGGDDRRGMRH